MSNDESNRSPNDWFYEAKRLAGAGEFHAALRAYETAIQLDPSFAKAWYYKAELHMKLGQNSDAATCAERAVELEPKYESYVSKMLAAQPVEGIREPPLEKKETWLKIDHTLDRFYQELFIEGRRFEPYEKPERHMRNVYNLLDMVSESHELKPEHLDRLLDYGIEAHMRGTAFFFDGMTLAEKIASVLAARDYGRPFPRNVLAAPDMVSRTVGWIYESFVGRIMSQSERIVYSERGRAEIENNRLKRTGFYFVTDENLYIPGSYVSFCSGNKIYLPVFSQDHSYHWNLDIFPLKYVRKVLHHVGLSGTHVIVLFEKIPYLFMEEKGSLLSNLIRESIGLGRSLQYGDYSFRLLLHPHLYAGEEKGSAKLRTLQLAEHLTT